MKRCLPRLARHLVLDGGLLKEVVRVNAMKSKNKRVPRADLWKAVGKEWLGDARLYCNWSTLELFKRDMGVSELGRDALFPVQVIAEDISEEDFRHLFAAFKTFLPATVRPNTEIQRGLANTADDICNLSITTFDFVRGGVAPKSPAADREVLLVEDSITALLQSKEMPPKALIDRKQAELEALRQSEEHSRLLYCAEANEGGSEGEGREADTLYYAVSSNKTQFAQFMANPSSSHAVSEAMAAMGWGELHSPILWETPHSGISVIKPEPFLTASRQATQ
ncbi:hypothetical protein DIPPA_16341 [Diplonema papillatum]|nr:hypothetical protein DIPPA_16341 [Diplonema papillatum]